jgi:hypothetical protein
MCFLVALASLADWLLATAGFLLISYGLLRQSFSDLTEKRGYGEGRYGEGPYGGRLTTLQTWLVSLGKTVRLLPGDESLTVTDRKRNAASAIAGVVLVVVSFAFDFAGRFLISCPSKTGSPNAAIASNHLAACTRRCLVEP